MLLFVFSTATRVSKGRHDPAITMSCGTTATSALTSWRSSPTTSATSTRVARGNMTVVFLWLRIKTVLLGRCPTPPPPTTRTWWQTERGNTTTSSQPRTAEVLVAREAVHTTSQTSRRGTLRSLSRRLLHSPCTLSSLYSPLHSLYSPLHPDWCTFSLYKR